MQTGTSVGPTDAWLSSGVFDYTPAPGKLELTDGRIRFTVVAPPGAKNARWLEQVTGQPGLAERVLKGESVTVLDTPLSEVRTRWPVTTAGSYLQVRRNETLYRIYFYNAGSAAGRPGRGLGGIISGRAASRPFREALKEPPTG
jgi:hypothetical protein